MFEGGKEHKKWGLNWVSKIKKKFAPKTLKVEPRLKINEHNHFYTNSLLTKIFQSICQGDFALSTRT